MDPSIEELQGMLARRDRFFVAVLHELRNPLAPIASAIEILARCGDDRRSVSSARVAIQRQLRLLTRLVDDLADVTQIVQGRVILNPEVVDLADVVAMALETAGPLIEAREHELSIRVPRGTLIVEADEVRLAQVIINLLINAAKYTRIGGRIEVNGELAADRAIVRVRDNGIGIAPEMWSRIFEPFTRLASCSTAAQDGLGMGLAVARELVELHGGSIAVCSGGANCGSEFAVSLPLRCVGEIRRSGEHELRGSE